MSLHISSVAVSTSMNRCTLIDCFITPVLFMFVFMSKCDITCAACMTFSCARVIMRSITCVSCA
jgi:hypothetical protein